MSNARRETSRFGWVFLMAALCLAVFIAGCQNETARKPAPTAAVKEQIRTTAASSFVIVSFHPKKSDKPHAGRDDDDWESWDSDYDDDDVLNYVLYKRTKDVPGLLLDDTRVLIGQSPLKLENIDRITVKGLGTATVNAEPGVMLERTCGQIVRLLAAAPPQWQCPAFAEPPAELTRQSDIYAAKLLMGNENVPSCMQRPEIKPYLSVSKLRPTRWHGADDQEASWLVSRSQGNPTLLCDGAGKPIGITTTATLRVDEEGPVWQAADVLAETGFDVAVEKERIRTAFAKYVYTVKVVQRSRAKEDSTYSFGGFDDWGFGGRSSGTREQTLFGIAVGPQRLLLNCAFLADTAANFDELTVEIGDDWLPARFEGILDDLDVAVLTLEEGAFTDTIDLNACVTIRRGAPFWAIFTEELAGLDMKINCHRWLEKRRGYNNEWFRDVAGSIRAGSWLVDVDGRFAGIYTDARHSFHRLVGYLKSDGYGSGFGSSSNEDFGMSEYYGRYNSYDGESDRRIYDGDTLAQALADAPVGYDIHVKQLSEDNAKKRAWLGVEYTGMSKEMAKQMDLREATQDGRLGLIINRVYPDSPAAEMGLTEGDILLTLATADAPWPIELTPGDDDDYSCPDFSDFDMPEEMEGMCGSMPRKRPWPSRGNAFTKMLKTIGVGQEAAVKYLRNGEEMTGSFTIAQSPPDALSAAKHKDIDLGITVKDLTYEVRAALRLKVDDAGIVVSKIESGTPAALARIAPFELIRAVDDRPITKVDDFSQAIDAAREADAASVRVTVETMGKTRLADIKFGAKQAPSLLGGMFGGRGDNDD